MSKVSIYGFKGSQEELCELLTKGMTIRSIKNDPSEERYFVEFADKPGRKRNYNIEEILNLRKEGYSFSDIAKIVGCSRTYANSVCKKLKGE